MTYPDDYDIVFTGVESLSDANYPGGSTTALAMRWRREDGARFSALRPMKRATDVAAEIASGYSSYGRSLPMMERRRS